MRLVETRERGGVLLRFADAADAPMLGFIPADAATRVAALSSLVPVPGAPPAVAGIALADGAVVTVLRVGDAGAVDGEACPSASIEDAWPIPGARRAILCRVGAHDVALTGGTVVATGVFDAAPAGEGIVWCGQMVPPLDVRALYAQAEAATWALRAAPSRAASRPAGALRAPEPVSYDDGDDGERATWLPDAPARHLDDTRRGRR